MATINFRISKKVAEKMAATNPEVIYFRKAFKSPLLFLYLGASSETGMVEFMARSNSEDKSPAMVYFPTKEFTAAFAENSDVEVSFEDGVVYVNGTAMSETEPPASLPSYGDMMKGAVVYDGDARGIPDDCAALVGKDVCEFYSGAVKILDTSGGSVIIGATGLKVVKVRPEITFEPAGEDVVALFDVDRAIASGAQTWQEAQEMAKEQEEEPTEETPVTAEAPVEAVANNEEVPFEGGTVVTPEAKTENKANAENKKKEKKEEPMEEAFKRVLKLEDGESAAFLINPKSLSEALEAMTAVAPGAKVSIGLMEDGDMIALEAYKEPVMARFALTATKVSGEPTVITVNLDHLATLVRAVIGIEDEIRIGVEETRIRISGSESKVYVPLVTADTVLKEAPDEGVAAALYPSSLMEALRSSVCFGKEKASVEAFKDLLFTITEGGSKVCVYTSDGHSASCARIKGRTAGSPEDCRFTVPIILRNIKWPETTEGDEKPIKFNFGARLLMISMPGRQFFIRYKAAQFPNIERFFAAQQGGTKTVLKQSETKERVGYLLTAAPEEKGPAVFDIGGNVVKAKYGDANVSIGTYGKTTGNGVAIALSPRLLMRNLGAFAPDDNLFCFAKNEKEPFYMATKDGSLVVLTMPVGQGNK